MDNMDEYERVYKERDEYREEYERMLEQRNELCRELEQAKWDLGIAKDERKAVEEKMRKMEKELYRLKDLCESYEGTICGLCKALSIKGGMNDETD